MDVSYYKNPNKKGYRFILVVIEDLLSHSWGVPLKYMKCETLKKECSNILSTTKGKPIKIESDRGKELYNSVFQIF